MSVEEIKGLERSFYDAMNQRNPAALDKILAKNFVDHNAIPGIAPDREGFKQFFAMAFAAFPDFHSTLEDMVVEGDKAASRFTARGTHKGEWMGIKSTGKQMTITGIGIHRFAGDKMTDNWVSMDTLGMMQQLGVVPAPGK